tara:strand:- start:80367 stop:80516 length:150 start_codon:yes stop_codon:yes gene_type:complete
MAIGTLSILVGIYQILKGKNLSIYYYSILIGIVLIGTTYYNNQQKNKNE